MTRKVSGRSKAPKSRTSSRVGRGSEPVHCADCGCAKADCDCGCMGCCG